MTVKRARARWRSARWCLAPARSPGPSQRPRLPCSRAAMGGAGAVAAGAASAGGAGIAAGGIDGLAAVVAGPATGGNGLGNGLAGVVAGACAPAAGRGAAACGRGRAGAGVLVCADAESANATSGSSAASTANMQKRNGKALINADRATRRPPWLLHGSVFMSHPPKPPSTPPVTDRKLVQQMTLFNKRRYNVAGRKSSRIRLCAPSRRALELIERKFGLFSIFVCVAGDQPARPSTTDPLPAGSTHRPVYHRRRGLARERLVAIWDGVRSRPHAGSADRRASVAVTPAKQEGFAANSAASARRSRAAISSGERACATATPPSDRNRQERHI